MRVIKTGYYCLNCDYDVDFEDEQDVKNYIEAGQDAYRRTHPRKDD